MAGYGLKSDVAKQITKMRFVGDIIPHSWYQHIRKSDKKTKQGDKPYLLAIMILANIIYWYRLEEVRDEKTDLVIGYRQKFKHKKLQKSYNDYSQKYGVGKRTIKRAFDYLTNKGLIKREFDNLNIKGECYNNVMFIEPVVDKIKEITYKHLDSYTPPPDKDVRRVQNSQEGGDKDGRGVVTNKSGAPDKDGKTNTKNTTDITTENSTEENKKNNKGAQTKVYQQFQRAFGYYPNKIQQQKITSYNITERMLVETIIAVGLGGHNETFLFNKLDRLQKKGVRTQQDFENNNVDKELEELYQQGYR